ncbi:MAG: glycosyltransferase family 2 protein [Mycobacterium sp.]
MSVIILTRDEDVNIRRCISSVAWAKQVIVVDSGSTDDTIAIAKSLGAEVVEQPWMGYAKQRELALRLVQLQHNWVYFIDADEWISPALAAEVATRLGTPSCAGYSQRLRLVFMGKWIRHCGWYSASEVVRLVDRRYTNFDDRVVGERARVEGVVRRLQNDIVDEDLKGLAAWLHKHVNYATLEVHRRGPDVSLARRLRMTRLRDKSETRPFIRVMLRDVVFPSVPFKPLALFLYMYIVRSGFLDGMAGLRFCFYHAWYEVSVNALKVYAPPRGELNALAFSTGKGIGRA